MATPDERRARLYAASAFADETASRSFSGLLPAAPWMLPAVVAAERAIGLEGGTVPEGTVVVPDNPDDPRDALRVLTHGEA